MKPTKRKSATPVTAHPLFPALVALWFGALFGLGSFAVQPAVLEGIVAATHLSALVPAAAPPLGGTARVLVAILLTVAGLGLGAVIGLRLRPRNADAAPRRRAMTPAPERDADAAPRVRQRDSHPDAPVCKPLILSEELAAEPLAPATDVDDDDDDLTVRRRALVSEADVRHPDPVEHMPSAALADPFGDDAADRPDEAEAAEYAEFTPVADDAEATVAPSEPAAGIVAELARPLFAMPEAIVPGAPRSPVADAPLGTLGLVQLIERLALAIAERRAIKDLAFAETPPFEAPAAEPAFSPPAEQAAPAFASPLFQQAVSGRLGASPAPDATVRSEDEPTEWHEPAGDDAAIAPSPYSPLVRKPLQRIAALRAAEPADADFASDEPDEDDDAFAVPRFLGGTLQPVAISDAADEEPEPPVPEDRYPSLADMPAPLPRQEFIRVDVPLAIDPFGPDGAVDADAGEAAADADPRDVEPVVVFPGQAVFGRPAAGADAPRQSFVPQSAAAPDPAEADRALRAALATLQRMTAKG